MAGVRGLHLQLSVKRGEKPSCRHGGSMACRMWKVFVLMERDTASVLRHNNMSWWQDSGESLSFWDTWNRDQKSKTVHDPSSKCWAQGELEACDASSITPLDSNKVVQVENSQLCFPAWSFRLTFTQRAALVLQSVWIASVTLQGRVFVWF